MLKLFARVLVATTIKSQSGTTLREACPNDIRCGDCNGNRCEACYDSYVGVNGVCQVPTQKVDGCLQYASNGKCAFCQHGLYVDNLGLCQRVNIKDCHRVRATNMNRCEVCKEGVLVTSDGQCNGNR